MYNQPVQNQMYNAGTPANNDKMMFYIYLACCAAVVVGCFLPFATISVLGFSQSINFVSNGDQTADGILVIAAIVVAAVFVFKKKHIIALVLQGIGAAIFLHDFFNVKEVMSNSYGTGKIGIGAWIILIGLIGACVLAFLLWRKEASNPVAKPQVITNTYTPGAIPQVPTAPTQPTSGTTCPYCGSQKRPDQAFCPNCGAKV